MSCKNQLQYSLIAHDKGGLWLSKNSIPHTTFKWWLWMLYMHWPTNVRLFIHCAPLQSYAWAWGESCLQLPALLIPSAMSLSLSWWSDYMMSISIFLPTTEQMWWIFWGLPWLDSGTDTCRTDCVIMYSITLCTAGVTKKFMFSTNKSWN